MKALLALIACSLLGTPALAQEPPAVGSQPPDAIEPAIAADPPPDGEGAPGASSVPVAGEPSAIEREAQLRHEAGTMARAQGRLEDALLDFRRANELAPSIERLWSIAEVLEALRRDRELVDTYRAYVELAPVGDARLAEVRARVAVLERTLAAAPEQPAQPVQAARETTVLDEPWFWGLVGVGAAALIVAVLFATASPGVQAPVPGDDGVIVRTLVELP